MSINIIYELMYHRHKLLDLSNSICHYIYISMFTTKSKALTHCFHLFSFIVVCVPRYFRSDSMFQMNDHGVQKLHLS
jgi:hypothetical protein